MKRYRVYRDDIDIMEPWPWNVNDKNGHGIGACATWEEAMEFVRVELYYLTHDI